MNLGFVEGGSYNRIRDIHNRFDGQRQGGIITPRKHPVVFLISGASGEKAGYHDKWFEDGRVDYFGQGQKGDMEFSLGNKVLRDHADNAKQLHLFKAEKSGALVYQGEYVLDGYRIRMTSDVDGKKRRAIVFHLIKAPLSDEMQVERAENRNKQMSLSELRRLAKDKQGSDGSKGKTRTFTVYERSAAIRRYVRGRARGKCEGCGAEAPFSDKKGEPYLEPHHTTRVADGGPDMPENVIALCPNCHRRVHSGKDGEQFNRSLRKKLKLLEP